MITVRKAAERGTTRTDWLDSRHSFSFGGYRDAAHMGFGLLRVINEDRVVPGAGFGMHPHRDMEILTWVLAGALKHQDTLGTGSIIRPGDLQRMSAGTGILHSEENPSSAEPVHFLQIWIVPEREGLKPEYEGNSFDVQSRTGKLARIAGKDGAGGAVRIHQDVDLFASLVPPGGGVVHALRPRRQAWLQVARGTASINGVELEAGDGAAARDERTLDLRATGPGEAELLLFDLP